MKTALRAVLLCALVAVVAAPAAEAQPDKPWKSWFPHIALQYSMPQGDADDALDDGWGLAGGATYKPEGWNNVPRKEAAAYQIQKWFLDPHEYVVPPTVTRCIRLEEFRVVDPEPEPTADSGTCVFGASSLWIVDVEVVKRVFDEMLDVIVIERVIDDFPFPPVSDEPGSPE